MLKSNREVIAGRIVEKSKKLRKIENSMLKSIQKVIVRLCRRIVNKLSKKLRKIENSILKSSQGVMVTFVKKLSKKLRNIEKSMLKNN